MPLARHEAELDLMGLLPQCDIDLDGLVVDLGTPAAVGRLGWDLGSPNVTSVEHDGSTWSRVAQNTLRVRFVLHEPSPLFVTMRVAGATSNAATVFLDDRPLGTVNFGRNEIRTATTPTTRLPVDAGAHTLTLVFSGKRKDDSPRADLDWLRIGRPTDTQQAFGAPTLRDTVADGVALRGVPHRSIAVRSPGAVRCPVRPPAGAVLKTAVGLQGAGAGTAKISILEDGKSPVELTAVKVVGGADATWAPVELPLSEYAGRLITLELAYEGKSGGGRALFGDPRLVTPSAPVLPSVEARAAVVVVLHGLERDELPGYAESPSPVMPNLAAFAAAATRFDHHRAPSTHVTATMATLLTERPPLVTRVADNASRLAAGSSTLARVAREANVHAGFFTGVPQSFTAFGLHEHWERFVQHTPMSGEPASAPLRDAAAFAVEALAGSTTSRVLTVVHARGAHPPWDVTPKELEASLPPDLGGALDPRAAAQQLARARKKPNLLAPADFERARVFAGIGLAAQDKALGQLIAALKNAGVWDQTLFVVTTDLSSGGRRDRLYADSPPLGERALALPLWVHFPGGHLGGTVVDAATEVLDVAATVALTLGLPRTERLGSARPKGAHGGELRGRDLRLLAVGALAADRPQVARQDDLFSVRWGAWVLEGRVGQPPRLCHALFDPTCAFDRTPVAPLAAQALFQAFAAWEQDAQALAGVRQPLDLDTDTSSSLSVWGETGD